MLRYRPRSDSQEEETEEVPDFDTLPRVYVERTLAIIKPDAIHKSEEIEDVILKEGFTILQVGLVCFSNQFENTDKNNIFQVYSVSAPSTPPKPVPSTLSNVAHPVAQIAAAGRLLKQLFRSIMFHCPLSSNLSEVLSPDRNAGSS